MTRRIRTPEILTLPSEAHLRAALEHGADDELVRRIADELIGAIYQARDASDLRPVQSVVFRAWTALNPSAGDGAAGSRSFRCRDRAPAASSSGSRTPRSG